MSDGSTHRRRALVSRRPLSDDVRKHAAVSATKSASDAPLPLAQPPAKTPEPASERGIAPPTGAMVVQTQPAEGGNTDEVCARPSPQQIADRVASSESGTTSGGTTTIASSQPARRMAVMSAKVSGAQD